MSGFNAGSLQGAVVLDLGNWSGNVTVVKSDAKQVSAVMTGDLSAASKAASGAIQSVSTAAKEAAVTTLSVSSAQKTLAQSTAAVAAESKVAATNMREEAAAAKQVESATDRLKGQLAEIRGTFGRRGLVGQLVQLGLGGGAIGGINLLFGQLENFAKAGEDASISLRTGAKSAGQVADELARSIPILGHIYSMGQSISELFTGEKAELSLANAELDRITLHGAALKKLIADGEAFAKTMGDAAREARNAIEVLSAPPSEQAGIARMQKLAADLAKLRAEADAKAKTKDPAVTQDLENWKKELLAAREAVEQAKAGTAFEGAAEGGLDLRAVDEHALADAQLRVATAQKKIAEIERTQREQSARDQANADAAQRVTVEAKVRADIREVVDRAKAWATQAGGQISAIIRGLRGEALKEREDEGKKSTADAADLRKQAMEDANELARSMAETTKALHDERQRIDELHTDAEISNLRRVGRVFKAEQLELAATWKKRIDAAVSDEERLAAKQAFEAARRLQRQRQEEELRQHPREHARDRADLEGERESRSSAEARLRRQNRGLEPRGSSSAGRGPSPQFRRSAEGRRRFGEIVDDHLNDLNGAHAAAAAVHVNVQPTPIDTTALASAIGQEVTNKLLPQVRQEIQRIQAAANAAAHAANVKGRM